jgi:hypothetical protein
VVAAVEVALKLADPLVCDLNVLLPHALATERRVANRALERLRCGLLLLLLVVGRLRLQLTMLLAVNR